MNSFEIQEIPSSLLIIAGWGAYPRIVIEGARKVGVKHISVLGFKGSTSRSVRAAADEASIIPFGSLSLFIAKLKASGCDAAVMAGQISPLSFFSARFDNAVKDELARIPVKNAHSMFGRLVEIIGENGIPVLPASFFMNDHIPPVGVLTKVHPDRLAELDLDLGFRCGMQVCNLDIGQTLVVKDGVVLAVEGFDGTNATLKRGGRISKGGASVVKVAKDGHDSRFDIPVIGIKTLKLMRRYRMKTLGIQAGRTLMLDMPALIAYADKYEISIEARDSGLPSFQKFCKAPQLSGQ